MSNKREEIYMCPHCGNVVEVVRAGGPIPVCCGDPMKLMAKNTEEAATEKHIPVVEKVDGGCKVVVGSVAHPMTEAHLIEWIELVTAGSVYRKYLKAGGAPEAFFAVDEDDVTARAYCNLHGLWKA
jgi:superoxide reductase